MNASEQIARSVVLLNAAADGTLPRAVSALSYAPPGELGKLAKMSGMSAGQLEEWRAGSWTPPVDQLLVLLTAVHDRFRRELAFEAEDEVAS